MSPQAVLWLSLSLTSAALIRIAPGTDEVYPPYKSESSTCLNETSEYFDSRISMCCTRCSPGMKREAPCTEKTNTKCQPCGQNQYTAFWNMLKKCLSCQVLCKEDQDMVQDCTPTTKRICQCKQGLHCIDSAKNTCNQCRRNTECKEGQGVIKPGTKDTDVECAPCPPGTFSNKVSSTEPCQPHVDCAVLRRKILQNGTSTRNAICGDEILPLLPTLRGTPSRPQPSSPAPKQVTHLTEIEPISVTSWALVTIELNRTPPTKQLLAFHWVLAICVSSIVVILVIIMMLVCVLRRRTGRKPDLWNQNPNMPTKNADSVEMACLIGLTENELEAVKAQNGTLEQKECPTGTVARAEHSCSLSRSSNSSGSGGVQRKPGPGYSSKEEERPQTHLALAHLNNYSRIDSQEDQGYISRESRPSSGAPSPVMEFSGNPTVSVTINTGKCYVNCCHRPGDGASRPLSPEEDYPAPAEEEGTEVDEGFPIQEEHKDSESENWKEAGVPVEAESEGHWQTCNSVQRREDVKDLQLPIQDTSGKMY
ncbi:tumor necrosis factor receptor superfamily member 1B-like isoform X1 [Hemiscyllium ocellatum]|uniref:tumor necrosis factor receptor superfamily member 1B-like isoform X1 n=3 Tax=Hemiscyllium ocellatum TaxID=170820 RepID=UPI002967484A|nr:tumor necrosis factor receptor superfamily member 1B-like isoform X1 [Hemiscyllium ocellatum]